MDRTSPVACSRGEPLTVIPWSDLGWIGGNGGGVRIQPLDDVIFEKEIFAGSRKASGRDPAIPGHVLDLFDV